MNLFKKLFSRFSDPCYDPRCKDCAHIDGLLCPYPNECSAMYNPIQASVKDYLFLRDHKVDIDYLLDYNYWLVVYPHLDGYTYEFFHKYAGKWMTLGSNAIYSAAHLYPRYSSKEIAWQAGVKHLKTIINDKNDD